MKDKEYTIKKTKEAISTLTKLKTALVEKDLKKAIFPTKRIRLNNLKKRMEKSIAELKQSELKKMTEQQRQEFINIIRDAKAEAGVLK